MTKWDESEQEHLTDEERLAERFTEGPAARAERIAAKVVEPETAAVLARLWSLDPSVVDISTIHEYGLAQKLSAPIRCF